MFVVYIPGGNTGGNFKLDPTTGVLSASSLDRETISKYVLTISAKDKGHPSLEARCNITVIVLDVNDNSPSFTIGQYPNSRHPTTESEAHDYQTFGHQTSFPQYGSSMYPNNVPAKYMASVFEDVPTDSSIITVRATDPDQGANGKITYSVAEETTWLFRVDNLTGVITTAG